jgi:hypothetical protein
MFVGEGLGRRGGLGGFLFALKEVDDGLDVFVLLNHLLVVALDLVDGPGADFLADQPEHLVLPPALFVLEHVHVALQKLPIDSLLLCTPAVALLLAGPLLAALAFGWAFEGVGEVKDF